MSDKMAGGFAASKKSFGEKFKSVFTGSIDEQLYENLMEILVLSDIPYTTAERIVESAQKKLKRGEMKDEAEVRFAIRESIIELSEACESFKPEFPAYFLVLGVNGAGKTTTIAKLASIYKNEGKRVLLAAGDTFRAAACEQLEMWANRIGVGIVKSTEGQSPASVVFDSIQSAQAKQCDVVFCDTAGRLQSKKNLMEEITKIYKVAQKNIGDRKLYTILVLDAMSGQNSLSQLESFSECCEIDSVILTKTDGSAKGGILLGIMEKYKKSVWYVGVGEGSDDLISFNAQEYAKALV